MILTSLSAFTYTALYPSLIRTMLEAHNTRLSSSCLDQDDGVVVRVLIHLVAINSYWSDEHISISTSELCFDSVMFTCLKLLPFLLNVILLYAY